MAETVLSVEGLGKTFRIPGSSGEKNTVLHALQDVSFSLKAGEVCGVIGRNGAGKSTLLKILSEITMPTTGRIQYRGRYTSILNVGTGFHPDLSGRENIYLKGQLLGMSRREIDKIFDEIVDFSGVEEFLEGQVKHYSDGMYLRLAYSIAFHSPAALLYLDEVISVGDANFRMKAFDKVNEVIRNGATIVMVSHHMSEITDLCSQAIFLENGRLEMMGSPLDVVECYNDRVLKGMRKELQQENLDFYRLNGVTVRASGKDIGDPIYVGDSIAVEIDIEKYNVGESMELVLFLVDVDGTQIVSDSPAFRMTYVPRMQESGRFKARVTIPANLLNRGIFRLHLITNRSAAAVLDQFMDVASFQVQLPEKVRNNRNLIRINSVLRLSLDWEIERI